MIVVARGGGSFEDLLPFSDERLVRAIAACPVPVVTAVGHEQDTPLCDLAADARASTPSVAARLVVPDLDELLRDSTAPARAWSEARGEPSSASADGSTTPTSGSAARRACCVERGGRGSSSRQAASAPSRRGRRSTAATRSSAPATRSSAPAEPSSSATASMSSWPKAASALASRRRDRGRADLRRGPARARSDRQAAGERRGAARRGARALAARRGALPPLPRAPRRRRGQDRGARSAARAA